MKALWLSLPVVLLASSCAYLPVNNGAGLASGSGYLTAFRAGTTSEPVSFHKQGYWDGDGVTGPAKIRINRAEQKAYFYRGNEVVGMSPISTGKSSHITPTGTYKVTEKDIDHTSSLYGVIKDKATGQVVNADADTRKHKPGPGQVYEGAPMHYFMRFNGGIGMHIGHLPGYAASHGCVRMPEAMAPKFYENAKIGTPVIVE